MHYEKELLELSHLSVFICPRRTVFSQLMELTKTCDQLNLFKVEKQQHTLYLKTYVSYVYEYSVLLVTLVITVSMVSRFPAVSFWTLITCVVYYRQLSFNSFYTEIKLLSHKQ
jgi:hypothetical protein